MTSRPNLPPEVLENIFSHSVSQSDSISFPANGSQWPWPLLSVNKQWQAVAIAHPDLWRRHEVTISRRLTPHEASQVINYHARLIKPSNRTRLSIGLSCASNTYSTEAISKVIKPNASSIVELRLDFVPFTALASLLNSHKVIKFPKIASVEMNFSVWKTDEDLADQFVDSGMFKSPTLRNLALYNSRYDPVLLDTLLDPQSFAWSHLTSLTLHWLDLNVLYEVLCRCRSLLYFSGSNILQFLEGTPSHENHEGCRPERLRSVTLANRLPPPLLLLRMPIPWEGLVVLDLGGREMYINETLILLQRCHNLQGLSAEVHIPRTPGALNLFQVHLPYLSSVRLDLEDGLLLRCLVVPSLTSLHINQLDRREISAPPFVFPGEEIIQMLTQSRCQLVEFQRRRRHFYVEEPPALDPGPQDLLYWPFTAIQTLVSFGMSKNARFFIVAGLVLQRPFLESVLMGKLFPYLEGLECAVEPQDVEIFIHIAENRIPQGRLRFARVTVPGIRSDQLQQAKYRLYNLSKTWRVDCTVDRPEEGVPRNARDYDDVSDDSTDSSSAGSLSEWMTDSEDGHAPRARGKVYEYHYRYNH
ncbi:hypothetical protein J132_06303 [Termitomyces sp. J132]|nr:hypothetical protein J132_06303 [Termitomyces sp. J132]